jgi:hypothetical protein
VVGAATKGLVSGAVDGGVVAVDVEEVELEDVVEEGCLPLPAFALALGGLAARPARRCLPLFVCLDECFSFLPA